MKKTSLVLLLACLVVISTGCQEKSRTQGSNLTAGMAKTKIINGVTTQSEILAVFSSPNIITKNKSGNEVWTYSTKTFTLMIEFDSNDIVQYWRQRDYR